MTCRPDRATGTRTSVVCQEETCWGEVAEDQTPLGVEVVSETLRNDINAIESQLIRGDRMRSPGQQGNHRPGGDISGELQPNGIWPLLWRHFLGGDVATNGSGPYTHQLQGDIDLPESLTFEKKFGFPSGAARYLRYLGSRVNEIELEITQEGIIRSRAGILSKEEQLVESALGVATYPLDNEPFNSFHGAILLDRAGDGTREAVATIQRLRINGTNSMDPDQYAINGTPHRADLPEDVRLFNGNLAAFFTPDNYALYQAYKDNTSLSLELTLTRGTHVWHFTIPQFKVRGSPTPQIAGRGPLSLEMDIEAHRDDDLGTDLLLTITNDDAALSTAA